MSMITTFNKAISDVIDKEDDFYKALIGQTPFTPESTIVDSGDFNCGALCNELEFVRTVSQYYVHSLDLDQAESDELGTLINAFIDLPRRGSIESDAVFRKRFQFIVDQKSNPRRTTRWAILDAITYFVDADSVQFIEFFDAYNCYFQIRFEGEITDSETIFLNSTLQSFINQNYIGGQGIGAVVTYIGDLISRIKAAGVDFDIYFVDQNSITKTSDAIIGTVQQYKISDAKIKAAVSFTKTSNAEITT